MNHQTAYESAQQDADYDSCAYGPEYVQEEPLPAERPDFMQAEQAKAEHYEWKSSAVIPACLPC